MHEAFYAYLESVLGTLRGTNVPTKTNAQVASSTSSHAGKRGEKLQLCSFYMKGKGCNRGKDCRYMHDNACHRCGKLTHLSCHCNIVPKEKQSFMNVEQSTQESSASKIDASEKRKQAKAEKAEAKAKEAAAKRAAEIRSVIETILNEPAPPG